MILEIIAFTILSLPLPTKFRKPLTLFIIKPFQFANVQTSIKCVLLFILILFVDSISKVYRINSELDTNNKLFGTGSATNSVDRIEIYSRKFLAQRNMYLTGITLFLTFTLVRTFNLVIELLSLKDSYKIFKKSKDINSLIEEKDLEIKRLKLKAELLQKEL